MSEALRETGAGVIGAARVIETRRRGFRDVTWQPPALARDERWTAIDQRGATVLLTGLPASGKSTIALLSLISPMAAHRAHLRGVHEHADLPFVEVFVDTPVEECERRDPKGLYARARAGQITDFTGVDAPYEPPEHPELRVDTAITGVKQAVAQIIEILRPAQGSRQRRRQ